MTSAALELDAVGRSFGDVAVLDGVSLSLAPGRRLAVVGPSGGGKTTLLRVVAGLDPPTRGTVAVAGRPASGPGVVTVPPEGRGVAMVFQGLALFPHLRALDQIAFAARGRGGVAHARELLGRVGLGHRGDARPDHLSGGERQRIALARALAQSPALLLMDEPFASLDEDRRAEMRDLLRSLLDGGTTASPAASATARPTAPRTALVLVTHSRDDALDLADDVLVLNRGRPVAAGPLDEVMARPGNAAVVRALGLGHVVAGTVTAPGVAATAFGPVRTTATTAAGPVYLLVRPGQPRAADGGTWAEVVAVHRRPPEVGRAARHVAVVRAGDATLPVPVPDRPPAVGDRLPVVIDGDCDPVDRG